ncbi:MAG: hypothetical protein FJY29_01515 [Betaproteobacteria bacterium]|nr:hypothetical protein [Betaproteobacteria bacterium]
MSHMEQRWRVFGRRLLGRFLAHFLSFIAVWALVILAQRLGTSVSTLEAAGMAAKFSMFWSDLSLGFAPGAATLLCVAIAWSFLGIAVSTRVSVLLACISIFVAASYARFPLPDQASGWLMWAGSMTPRGMQLFLIVSLGLASSLLLVRYMTRRYEALSSDDRLALTPEDEDFAYRDLVQSMLKFLCVLVSLAVLWRIADIRPVPAVAAADPRELRPSVILLSTDSSHHVEQLNKRMGSPHFSSWVVFGSPELNAKFDEILQCRYPIRLMGRAPVGARNPQREINDFLVPAALSSSGYSVNLLHAVSAGEASDTLKMFSRAYAHVRFFRRFGLLRPSRVFHTPDVQLAQMREAFTAAVGRGEPVFITSSMTTSAQVGSTGKESAEFETFIDVLKQQQWGNNLMIVVLELPPRQNQKAQLDLSLQSTTARVFFWMPQRLSEANLAPAAAKLIRGIDLGATLTARLRLSGVMPFCDGGALFDLSERPSLFPRDLVYQEYDLGNARPIFRQRGWLSSDGYRLEVLESNEGAEVRTYKFSMQEFFARTNWQAVRETTLKDEIVSQELNRQMDDFLRSTGVEILSLGEGRSAYSEPFRRIRLLER